MQPSRLQLRALVVLAAARLLLPRRGVTATLQRLARPESEVAVVDPHDAMRAVQRAGRVLRATCLAQSVALATLLEHDGQHPSLVLGCRRYGDNAWGAHAWVEVGTAVFEPVQAASHIELARLSAAGDWELQRADGRRS